MSFSPNSTETRKISRLTFEPAANPDEVIVKSFFSDNTRNVPASPFPRLHETVVQERTRSYYQKNESAKPHKPLPIIVIPTPTTPWYPEKPSAPPVLGASLALNLPTSLSSPRCDNRTAARRDVASSALSFFGGKIPPNCAILFAAAQNEMDDLGNLTAVHVTRVFQEVCGVVDITFVDNFYQLLDTKRKNCVPLLDFVAALDTIFNGPEAVEVAKRCFHVFEERNYIHKKTLDELRSIKDPIEREEIRTPEMIKVLGDLFLDIAIAEEEKYVSSLSKGKGAKKKKAPPLKQNQKSVIPLNMMRVSHMNFDTFFAYFTNNKVVAPVFARCWLPLVEESTALRLQIVQRLEDMSS